MEGTSWGFDTLPAEIKQLIFSFSDLDLQDVLSTQSVSKEFKKLSWPRVRAFGVISGNQKQLNRVVEQFIKNANPNLITRMNFSRWENPVESALAMLDKFPNLVTIHFDLRLDTVSHNAVRANIDKFIHHAKLNEITFAGGYWCRSEYDNKTFEQYDNKFYPRDPIEFDNKTYHRGGTIGDKIVVIGATDGTLTLLTLEQGAGYRKYLKTSSSIDNTHKGSINAIRSEVWSSDFNTYVASSDGIVTHWSLDNDKPVLKHTYSFAESILFVSEWSNKYVLAAGKQTLYIAEIASGHIIRQIAVHEDITGLFSLDAKCNLSTIKTIYQLEEGLTNDGVFLQKVADESCPNIWLSPDFSLRVTVHPTKVELFEAKYNSRCACYNNNVADENVKFDTRPHLSRFNPTRYWFTVSTGSSLKTFDLNGSLVTELFAIENKLPAEISQPECQSFWFSTCGNYLFALYSDQRLYWWSIELHYISTMLH